MKNRKIDLVVYCILLGLFAFTPQRIFSIEYSAFKHEINYTQYVSQLMDNYSYPEPPEYPPVKDSIEWIIPAKSWKHMKHMATALWGDYNDDFILFRYRQKTKDFDFYNRSRFIMGMDGTYFPSDLLPEQKKRFYNFFYIGFNQQAWLNQHWSFHSQFTYSYIRGDSLRGSQSPLLDTFYKYYGRHYELSNTAAGITFENRYLKMVIGRGRLSMGKSITGNILLNERVNEYPYLTAELQLKHYIISVMNAQLMADEVIAIPDTANTPINHEWQNKNFPDKYFAAHQFTWRPIPEFDVYVGETIVYGNQGYSLNYLLPHTYYRVTADSEHDRDNSTMHAGCDWYFTKKWLFYFQFMMDELRPEKLFKPWWGNKYAYQGGISRKINISPVKDQPSRITVEMTAIRPWTYTHYLMWSRYTNDKRCLGFPYGANLLHYAAKLEIPLPWLSSFSGYISYMRQGSVGSNVLVSNAEMMPNSYHNRAYWLQGKITNTWKIENSLRFGYFKHHRLFLSHAAEKNNANLKKWDHQIALGWQLFY